MKRVSLLLLFVLLFSLIPNDAIKVKAESSMPLTKDLVDAANGARFDKWNSAGSLTMTDGTNVNGVGLGEWNGNYNTWVRYDISDYSFTTLETIVSIDNKWKIGSRGATQFIIYADDKVIYSKRFVNATPLQKLKLPIPKGTKKLIFMAVLNNRGIKGHHGAIFADPTLTNRLPQAPATNIFSLLNLGVVESSGYYKLNQWNDRGFELSNGEMVGRAVATTQTYGDESVMWNKFYVEDYDYSTLETTVSIDNGWRIGSRGKTQAIIYADNKIIYSKTFTNKTPLQKLKLSLPSGTKHIEFKAVMQEGTQGSHALIFADPVLTYSKAPAPSYDSMYLGHLGSSDSSSEVYHQSWGHNPFELTDGTLGGRGYGLGNGYDNTSTEEWVNFYIDDMINPRFVTKLSLDNDIFNF